jgi:hypothetical protein
VAPVWTDVVAAPDRRRTALVAALVALVAIAAGWLAAGPGGPGAPRTTLLANSDLQVAVPVAWTGARTAPRIPGLGAHGAVTAGPGGSGQTGVEANVITYHPPSLLSKAMGAAVAGRVPAPAAVRLGEGVEAYRYDRLRLDGFAGRVTVYAVPTTDSVATLACYAPTALARRFDATCATVAATLRPTSARPVPVGPSRAFAARVSRELAGLRDDAAAPQRRLARATRRRDQAKAAQDLARAYERVAGALDELPDRVVDGIAIARAAAAIGDTAGAYDQLATAARTGAQADCDRARGALGAARTQLSKARRTFARGGYETR